MLELVQHVYVIARGELVGVALRLKNGSFCEHGMDRVGFGSGMRWFMEVKVVVRVDDLEYGG